MRTAIAILLVTACGGSTAKTSVPSTTTQAPPPMEQPATAPTPAAPAEQPAAPVAQDPATDATNQGTQSGAFGSLTGTADITPGFDDTDIYAGLSGDEPGKLGKGSGTGSGTGMKPRKAGPAVKIGQPQADGDLDKAIIRRYIKRNIQKIQYCYEKELLDKPKLGGATVTAQFTITTEGKVTDSEAKGLKNVDACVAAVISQIEFPKPKSGTVKVSYPFVFVSAGN